MSKNEDYNSEPVRFCARCYSLKVKYEESIDAECCAECGSSDILEASVEEWEKKYSQRYGHKYVVKNEDPKKSFIYTLSPAELKAKVYKAPCWREIIYHMYPHFPGGFGRIDSVLLFFDKLIKDNRLNDLKLLLFKWKV